jgi:hypothetical protein
MSAGTYLFTYTIDSISGGGFFISFTGFNGITRYAAGTYSEYVTLSSASTTIFLAPVNAGMTYTIDNVSVKEYLGQEVVPDSGCGSWLWEPQSTQLVTYSELFSNAAWNKNSVTLESGYLSPDGTNTAFKVDGNNSFILSTVVTGLVATSTRSIYARTVSGTGTAQLLTHNSNTDNIFTITEQWQRFEVSTANSSFPDYFYAVDFRGSGTLSEIILWGANATNDQDYATSYIPTSGSQVTRNQDVCNNGGSLASINSTEGTLYFEGSYPKTTSGSGNKRIAISDGTSSNRVMFAEIGNTGLSALITSQGINSAYITGSLDNLSNFKAAISYKQNDFALWINGLKVATDTSGNVPIGLNEIAFDGGDGTNDFFGKTKAVAVWKEALSDQELAELTYPTPTDPTFTLDFDTIAEQFTFARGSEATYVDAQGLIQSTNELGEELVVNGDFATDSNWTKGSGVTISNGKALVTVINGGYQSLGQSLTYISGKSYTLTASVNGTAGKGCTFFDASGNNGGLNTSNGGVIFNGEEQSVKFEFTANSNSNIILISRNGAGDYNFSIDNVSVKEVITATNTPRLDYSTGAEAFLLEPQSTNRITYSEDFSDASWNKLGLTINSNQLISPDGTLNADKSQGDGTNSAKFLYTNAGAVSSGFTYTFSAFVKKGSLNYCQLFLGSATFNDSLYSNFDLLNGTIGSSGGGAIPFIENYGNDWYRIGITATADVTGNGTAFLNLANSSTMPRAASFNTSDYIYIYGAMLEQQSYATSYIPTSGSTVTRNQDVCNNGGSLATINSTEGVLYAEIAINPNDDGSFRLISMTDASDSVRIGFGKKDNEAKWYIKILIGALNITSQAIDFQEGFQKIAIRYKSGDSGVYINGTKVITDTSNYVNTLIIDNVSFDFTGNAFPFFGKTKALAVWKEALSDSELQSLTTI